MLWPPRIAESYRAVSQSPRPWAVVYDPDGFLDTWCNPYLTFTAWQDAPPARVRRDARILAEAATWLEDTQRTWDRVTDTDWARYCGIIDPATTARDRHRRRLQTHVETLHRFYAFWHWYDPVRMPRQPFPARPNARRAWVSRLLAEAELPDPLPF